MIKVEIKKETMKNDDKDYILFLFYENGIDVHSATYIEYKPDINFILSALSAVTTNLVRELTENYKDR